jgi:hypothetical protein
MSRMKKFFRSIVFLASLFAATNMAYGQGFVRLQPTQTHDTLSSNGDSVTLSAANVGGFGSVKIQTLDSYSGTWEVQCSLDGITF